MTTTVDRSGCTAKKHGTVTAARYHRCKCEDARAARAAKQAEYRAAHRTEPGYVDSTDSAAIIRDLENRGYNRKQMARELGYKHGDSVTKICTRRVIRAATAHAVIAMRDQLLATPPEVLAAAHADLFGTAVVRVASEAVAPVKAHTEYVNDSDWVMVDRLIARRHQPRAELRPLGDDVRDADKYVAARRLSELGYTAAQIGEILSTNVGRVRHWVSYDPAGKVAA